MKRPRVEFYSDRQGQVRWRLVAANGRIVADSAEGYSDRHAAVRAWAGVRTILSGNAGPILEMHR